MNPIAISFALDGTAQASVLEPETVLRDVKVFEAGEYPDKNLTMTPEDLALNVAEWQPVMLDAGHPTAESPLDGKLGFLEQVRLENEGKSLWGTARLPKWFDDLLEGTGRKVSALVHPLTHQIMRLSLVNEGRIPDAAMFAAYSAFAAKHNTPHGRLALQDIHDATARAGAICATANVPAAFASRHEATAIQQIHDIATEHGAGCAALKPGERPYMFAAAAPTKEKRMSFKDTLKRWFELGMPDDLPAEGEEKKEPAPAAPAPALATVGTTPAADPEKVAMAKRIAVLEEENIKNAAIAFSNELIHSFRLAPARQAKVVERYVQAARDDAALGGIAFADGSQGSRVAALRKELEEEPVSPLRGESLPTASAFGLANRLTTPGAPGGTEAVSKQAYDDASKWAVQANGKK